MKVIFRNTKLEFETQMPIKVADLVGGYALKNAYPWGTSWAVLVDILTGELGSDAAPQAIFGTSITNDTTRATLTKNIITSIKGGAPQKITEGIEYSRCKIAIHSSGSVLFWNSGNVIEKTLSVGENEDTDIMVGCRRTSKTQPFLGKYAGIYIANNISAENLRAFLDKPLDFATNSYVPKNINGLVWKDSIGNLDLTLSNEAVVTEIVGRLKREEVGNVQE